MSVAPNLWAQMMSRRTPVASASAGPASPAGVQGASGPLSGPLLVAIIGTAGRKEDAVKMTKAVFDGMVREARRVLHEEWKLEPGQVRLVSGGAAWADHVAVTLWLQQQTDADALPYAGLQLYLPTTFESNGQLSRATDNGSHDWRANPGQLMNYQHMQFSQKLGRNTLYEIEQARAFGATLTTGNGFMARNKQVAALTDRVIAFTWGESTTQPKDGGTLHTWNACTRATVKLHIPLSGLGRGRSPPPTPPPVITDAKPSHSSTDA